MGKLQIKCFERGNYNSLMTKVTLYQTSYLCLDVTPSGYQHPIVTQWLNSGNICFKQNV